MAIRGEPYRYIGLIASTGNKDDGALVVLGETESLSVENQLNGYVRVQASIIVKEDDYARWNAQRTGMKALPDKEIFLDAHTDS